MDHSSERDRHREEHERIAAEEAARVEARIAAQGLEGGGVVRGRLGDEPVDGVVLVEPVAVTRPGPPGDASGVFHSDRPAPPGTPPSTGEGAA